MKTLIAITATVLASLTLSGAAFAQDSIRKEGAMAKDATKMTMQECKDHMAMSKKDGMKKDDMAMKKDEMAMKMDKTCADMMKGDGMKKDEMKK